MKRFLAFLFLALSGAAFATINAVNGVTASTTSNINGVTTPTAVNGQTLASGGSTPTVVAHTIAGAVSPGNSVTTSGITTTGANLIVISCAWYTAATFEVTISDSNGNTWTALTGSSANNYRSRIYYCVSPVVGSGHTFTASGTGTAPSISVQAWSGMSTSSPFDQQNGATTPSTSSLATGSITPSQANTVVITAAAWDGSRNYSSLSGGFTTTDNISDLASNHAGGAMGYLILTSATPTNPTWTVSGSTVICARIASFKY